MSVLIGLHVKRVLAKNAEVVGYVGDRVYPLAVPNGVGQFPFICYDTSGASGERTKDGLVNDVAMVALSVIAKKYEDAIKIGNLVRYAFDGKGAQYDEFRVQTCRNITYNDEYIADLDAYSVNFSMDFITLDY